jgi:hypothetical protein
MATHLLDQEEFEQDGLVVSMDKISFSGVTDPVPIQYCVENHNKLNMNSTSTLRTYAEATRAVTSTNANNISSNVTSINNLNSGLFSDVIKLTHTGFRTMNNSLVLTGSAESSSTVLISDFKRLRLTLTDTYSTNVSLSEDTTRLTPNSGETGYYLCNLNFEFYDNVVNTKALEIRMYDATNSAIKFSLRNTIVQTSTNFEYRTFSGSILIYLVAGSFYWFEVKSSNGGKINTNFTNITLQKMSKSL